MFHSVTNRTPLQDYNCVQQTQLEFPGRQTNPYCASSGPEAGLDPMQRAGLHIPIATAAGRPEQSS